MGIFGADYQLGRLLAGVAVAHGRGEGTITPAELDRAYSAHSTLTSVHPYAAFDLADDLTLWGRRATAAARWRRSNRTCAGRSSNRPAPTCGDFVTLFDMNELPSVALTDQFLRLCEDYGSQRLVVRIVAVGRDTGVSGLPASDDWTKWDADQMRAAVDYLRHKRGER